MNRRILVADDDEAIREMTQEILEREHYVVDSVDNGGSLVERAMSDSYNLILTDNHMPGMLGVDAVREIRAKDGPNRFTPIVMMTGVPGGRGDNGYFEQIKEEARGAGVGEVLQKPFVFEDLMYAVGRYVK